jgi:hypothetical protein
MSKYPDGYYSRVKKRSLMTLILVAGVVAEEDSVLLAVGEDEEGKAAEILGALDLSHDVANFSH